MYTLPLLRIHKLVHSKYRWPNMWADIHISGLDQSFCPCPCSCPLLSLVHVCDHAYAPAYSEDQRRGLQCPVHANPHANDQRGGFWQRANEWQSQGLMGWSLVLWPLPMLIPIPESLNKSILMLETNGAIFNIVFMPPAYVQVHAKVQQYRIQYHGYCHMDSSHVKMIAWIAALVG